MKEDDGFLTISEVSKLLSVHPNTLRNWERQGKIQSQRIGSRRDRRYLKSMINNLLEYKIEIK